EHGNGFSHAGRGGIQLLHDAPQSRGMAVFIAGIQVLTAELAAGRSVKMFSLLQNALKFWPRVAMLCILVYGAYLFWTVLPVGVILMIALAGPSVLLFFLALLVLAFQVWI